MLLLAVCTMALSASALYSMAGTPRSPQQQAQCARGSAGGRAVDGLHNTEEEFGPLCFRVVLHAVHIFRWNVEVVAGRK